MIEESSGALTKSGKGTLTLSGSNLYGGVTTLNGGALVISNSAGSATGTEAVNVTNGTLGGNGNIAGPVVIGTTSGTRAVLAPAHGGKQPLTLTIAGSLTFNNKATYSCTFKARRNQASVDTVLANGVTINPGATFKLTGTAQGQLTAGPVLIVIRNTPATPITGTFANLSEGSIVTVSNNNFQASYYRSRIKKQEKLTADR